MSADERTGWRDEALSRRHRTWGYNCPAVDVDFLLVEFDRKLPIALIDYKQRIANSVRIDCGLEVLTNLADMCNIPAFVVCYNLELTEFEYIGLNNIAKEHVIEIVNVFGTTKLTENQHKAVLLSLRGRNDEARELL